jgi:ABC-type nickel/cobalt efflux system permease component RcnA
METSLPSVGILALLGLGILFGLKHATEVDHIVAVSTIVSQHRSVLRSGLVGAMWGLGHTLALLVSGVIVLTLRVAIPESVSNWFEFVVALMIIALGASALWRALRKGSEIHLHKHDHDGLSHMHVHFHDNVTKHDEASSSKHSHAVREVGIKPLLIGTMHGLAGSGALTLLVLTQIKSTWLGLAYLGVFGLGSIAGMLLMSGLIGLPFALTSRNLTNLHHRLQTVAGVLSICFGIWYAYETGMAALL